MAQPYSDDLRSKLLEAYAAGAGGLKELAAQFRVSWGYSKKIRAQQLRTGEKSRPKQLRHGPLSQMSSEVQESLRGWVRDQPDLAEAELRERLAGTGNIHGHHSRPCLYLEIPTSASPDHRCHRSGGSVLSGG